MWTPARKGRSAGSGSRLSAFRSRRIAASILGLCAAALVTACLPRVQPRAESRELSAEAWADSVLRAMSPRDRAGQMVWPAVLADYTADESASWGRITKLITAERVGGFVMSVGSPIETAAKANAMQRLSAVPLIFGADYEAGAGFRARGGYFLPNGIYLGGATVFPQQMALGATRDTSLAYEQGRVTASEGRALGVHLAFAPVLDVNNNPRNPVIGPRSFGEDPRLVSALGASLIDGLQQHGLLATAKHFPGHGDTQQNSHLSITEVNVSRPRLDTVELVPFRRAVAAGVSAVMTFHGVIPALDTTPVPATLSPVVMRGLLRGDMGFRGLLITDALDMNGVLARVRPTDTSATLVGAYGAINSPGLPEVVKLAVVAGNDVLLMPLDIPTAIDAVVAGVREGRFTQERVDSSARRILMLKQSLGLTRNRFVDVEMVRSVVGTTANLEVADRIAERAVTLARDSLRIVPLADTRVRPRLLSVTVANRADLGAGTTFDAELRSAADVRSVWVDAADPAAGLARVAGLADSSEFVVIGSYIAQGTRVSDANAPSPMIDLVRAVVDRNPKTIVVAFGNPYFFQQIPFAPAYLIAWGGFPPSQRAAARAIAGSIPISGRLPISIPPALRLGDGEQRKARAIR